MYFKRLEIHGFKSFVDPCVIEFSDGITCIVGPNGSGKSNISDALRWVLGEQSPSQLRGNRMEEVIFNGTETRRPRGMAEVTLVIDNTSGILDIDYQEVAVTRRAYRSGENEYLINGSACRLKDIRTLFMDTGIGVDGYSIIGQGRIQEIISNKTEGRRAIFEEAAGITAYKTRKQEAERRLDHTDQNLDRIEDIIAELEGRVAGLEKESRKAERYLQLKDKYQALEVNIILRNIESAEKKAEESRRDQESLRQKADALARQDETVRQEAEAVGQALADLEGRIRDLSDRLPQLAARLSSAEKEAQFSEERRRKAEAELAQAEDQTARLAETGRARAEEREKLAQAAEEKRRSLREKEQALSEAQRAFDRIDQQGRDAGKTVEEGNDRLFQLHSEAASKKSEARSVGSYRTALENRRKSLQTQRETLAKEEAERSEQLEEAVRKEEEWRKQAAGIRTDQAALQKEQEASDRVLAQKRREREELRILAERMEARLRTIEEMEQNYEGYTYAVRYIMQAGLPGIEGTVAEKISVPEGMETAIETALGAAKQNIICAEDRDAKRAVQALKQSRAGRLTFLPVSTIRGHESGLSQSILGDPGFLGLASGIASYEERYRDIFHYLLGRTLVTKDLDAAIRLSKKGEWGLRFVTLEGEVVNAGGAITGGRYKKQQPGVLDRKNERIQLDAEVRKTRTRIARAEEDEKALAAQADRSAARAHDLDQALRQIDLALNAAEPAREALRTQARDAEDRMAKLAEELAHAEEELEKTQSLTEGLMAGSREAEEEIERLSRRIEAAMSLEQDHRQALEAARSRLDQCRLQVVQAGGAVDSAQVLLDRADREREDMAARLTQSETRSAALRKDLADIADRPETARTEAAAIRAEKEALDERLTAYNQAKKEKEARRSALEAARKQSEKELSSYRDQSFRMELSQTRSETQVEHLKARLWDDFEMSYAQARELRAEDFAYTASVKESRELREELRSLGNVNVGAIREYEEVRQRYDFLDAQRTDVLKAKEELTTIIRDMDRRIIGRFRDNFERVQAEFGRIFAELFGGGHAELRLEDEQHPLESGIGIIAQPPGKRLQNINLLSGGEKTMTAIALMFAVIRVKPTPFCILDEVEAALDEANIERFTRYLKNYQKTQFAVITHQKATMAQGDALFGVTMAEAGVSKIYSLRLGDPEADRFTE